MAISFKHTQSGLIKECPEGFSWTTFFFGLFPSAFRGMWGATAVMFFTANLAGLYYMFTLNKKYAEMLLEKGFVPAAAHDEDKIKAMGIAIGKIEKTPEITQEQIAS